jgi:hypothetical protein
MNCVNHMDRERVAFCQHCGRPLCEECVRRAGSVVFCEGCWTTRASAPMQPGRSGYPPAGGYAPVGSDEPSPGLAALLGFIPGVGAMYNGQYLKGIAHLIVFVMLVALADESDYCGLFVFGWICYMAFDAYHTACARRDGTALPDPFGFNDLAERVGFGRGWSGSSQAGRTEETAASGPGAASSGAGSTPPPAGSSPYTGAPSSGYTPPYTTETQGNPMPPRNDAFVPCSRRFPTGALLLIVLGVIFLVGNMNLFRFLHHAFFGPVVLIAFGVWIFVHKMIGDGMEIENDGTEFYRWRLARAVRSSFWVILVGVIWLLDVLHILSWSHSWPLFLIGAGVAQLFRHAMLGGAGNDVPPGNTGVAGQPDGSAAANPGSELAPRDPSRASFSGDALNNDTRGDGSTRGDQEGR